MNELRERIEHRTARIGVIGLGYVGLPLAVQCAKAGFHVVGVDSSDERVGYLRAGRSYLMDIPERDIATLVREGRLTGTQDYDVLREVDIIFICVPTPATREKAPDTSHVESAARGIATRLSAGQLIVLQSTTYPGTTDEAVLPLLEASGLHVGIDFYLAFVPERVDPGNQSYNVLNTAKVVGGVTVESTELTSLFLRSIAPEIPVHEVSSARVAEMTKLLENIFRSVNIALVNELALLCERMDIDMWEVIAAARTKPFGFMPFYPGAGVGGHCIPIDPYYLSWKAREFDFFTKFIELAAEVNENMPHHVVSLASQALNRRRMALNGANVLVLGVAFKKDIDDPRHSPAQKVIELLLDAGASVSYCDRYIPRFRVSHPNGSPLWLEAQALTDVTLRSCDCAIIVTPHTGVDYSNVAALAPAVVDCANATPPPTPATVVRLGSAPPWRQTRREAPLAED